MIRYALGFGWALLAGWLILSRSQRYRFWTPVVTMLVVLLTLLWVEFR